MMLTPRQLNRATLCRQMLCEREPLDVVTATRRAVALQAQEPASPYVALWNRIASFDPGDLDGAFSSGAIVKAPLMRMTLHAVAADEYTTFHQAMSENLRAARLRDRRFEQTGLSVADTEALVPHLVKYATEVRTKEEVDAFLESYLGNPPHQYVWWALRTFAPLIHAPTGGAWSFGQRPAYLAAPSVPNRLGGEDAVGQLIWRYLEGFGPATVQDVGQFAMLRQSQLRPALVALEHKLVIHEDRDGRTYFDVPSGAVPGEDTVAPPRLLGMWDSVLLAYSDRSRVIPEQYRKLVIRTNGDVLPTLLVDGYVVGVWRHIEGRIEALAFCAVDDSVWSALEIEATGLLDLLAGRDERLYGRYSRWWQELPVGERRFLGG